MNDISIAKDCLCASETLKHREDPKAKWSILKRAHSCNEGLRNRKVF